MGYTVQGYADEGLILNALTAQKTDRFITRKCEERGVHTMGQERRGTESTPARGGRRRLGTGTKKASWKQ